MSKTGKIITIVVGVAFFAWMVARITGVVQFYHIPTIANDPNIKEGDYILVSNKKQPKAMDFVCFNAIDYDGKPQKFVFRLCGIAGDLLEIKNGDLYVNNKLVDNKLNLKHFYSIPAALIDSIPENILHDYDLIQNDRYDSVTVALEDKWVEKKFPGKSRRYQMQYSNAEIKKQFSRDWTPDNFGPIKVPDGKMFFLGDNRDNAYDSRYIGFVDKDKIIGTVFQIF